MRDQIGLLTAHRRAASVLLASEIYGRDEAREPIHLRRF